MITFTNKQFQRSYQEGASTPRVKEEKDDVSCSDVHGGEKRASTVPLKVKSFGYRG